ncbi:Sodium channel protein Nach [Cyphomyrmex costatus]|uniref:Sodium channel protein Nach n=1 Tax=Cyphomyrmex costatus TaxID=456900 RepID=A0A151IQ85_9HYME|nr:Sodium channel protein Nach [Cyphomyrmex costatus]
MKKHLGWFNAYCKNTNLHGFRYINIDGSSIIENVLWFTVCISSIVLCVILMWRLWTDYWNNPTVTTIYTSNPVWNMPFPAVTICNNNKVYRPYADLIAENLYKYGFTTNDSDNFFTSLTKLIRPNKISMDNATAQQLFDKLNMTVEALMEQLMQPCSALLLRCLWIGEIHDCNKIFKTVKSKEGFCCAFNSHYLDGGDMADDVKPNITDYNSTSDDLPGVHTILNAPGSGQDMGLAVVLNVEPDMYKATTRPYVGASVMIQHAIDFPDIGAQILSVTPGQLLTITLTGTSIRGMESLRDISSEKRLCYFDNEVPGRDSYSYQSCVSECMANHIHNLCGCLPFYYPEMHNAEVKRCNKKCLPECTDMLYTILPEKITPQDVGFDSDLMHGFDINNVSFVYVFFGDVSYVEYRKENIISWDSLLASFGGIFGLCLGGSVLSIIELAYLLARQFFRRQTRKWQAQFARTNLPPASEVSLSIPAKEKIQLGKPQNSQESNEKRVFVTWYKSVDRRKTNLNNSNHMKRVKF